jgi:secreted trypsin-like serine protease
MLISSPEISLASRNGLERPLNSFTVGITFKNSEGISDLCSGALISPTFIVTAAHCVSDTNKQIYTEFVFTAPATKLDAPLNSATQPKILKTYIPDGYFTDSTSENNDIAFIQLDRKISNSGYIRPATLNEVAQIPNDADLNGYGFGAVFETGEQYSTVAREYGLIWSSKDSQDKQTIKLTSKNSVGCSGDSGGPITTKSQSGEEILIATLHSAAFVENRCGTPAPDGLFYMQVSLIAKFLPLVDAELVKSLAVSTPSPKPSRYVKPKIYKITCLKGKTKKYVSGTAPKCPAGYKQIAKILISK